ncbi:protein of unknown function [Clostridium beijerinckii]|nr:protein of unknown function [Clostridium beijerinckii]
MPTYALISHKILCLKNDDDMLISAIRDKIKIPTFLKSKCWYLYFELYFNIMLKYILKNYM